MDVAARHLLYLLEIGKIDIHTDPCKNKHLDNLTLSNKCKETVLFPPYWCIRPGSGDSLAMNFVTPYKDDIRVWVEEGVADKGKRMSMAQIQEQIQNKYRNRYDIPTTHNINLHVKSVLEALKSEEGRRKSAASKTQSIRNGQKSVNRTEESGNRAGVDEGTGKKGGKQNGGENAERCAEEPIGIDDSCRGAEALEGGVGLKQHCTSSRVWL